MSARRYLLGWLALVVATAAVSAGAVVVVRQAIGGGDLVNSLSQSQVQAQYDAAGRPVPNQVATTGATPTPAPHSTSATPPPKPQQTSHPHSSGSATSTSAGAHHSSGSATSATHSTPPPTPTAVTSVLSSPGGSVVVRCSSASASASVYLVSWSPAQGYRVDEVRRGPGQEAEIDFEGGSRPVHVTFTCSTGGPVQQIEYDDGASGSGGTGGGGGGGDG